MNMFSTTLRSAGLAALVAFATVSGPAKSDDIDIFIAPPGGGSTPAVLFVLDNTSNWAAADQQFPGEFQGQAEVKAIQEALQNLEPEVRQSFRVGVMEFVTGDDSQNANNTGGYVRYHMRPMVDGNFAALSTELNKIYAKINTPVEMRNSNTQFGDLLNDAHNYIAGTNSLFPDAVPSAVADKDGYDPDYTKYVSPIKPEELCAGLVIIFIGNPNSQGPALDENKGNNITQNTDRLKALGGDTTQMKVPELVSVSKTVVEETSCLKSADCPGNTLQAVKDNCPAPNGTNTTYDQCICTVTATSNCAANNQKKYKITAFDTDKFVSSGQEVAQFKAPINGDEWSRYLYDVGVKMADGSRLKTTTYTVDVFNKKPNKDHSALLLNMANKGNGKYFQARDRAQIIQAISAIFSDIQSVNSTFASAALPISATNRSQNDNQVFIGMFRPDPKAGPRWFGNLKQYQLVVAADGSIQLGDANKESVVNPLTGFVGECTRSIWTFDTGDYFLNTKIDPSPKGLCTKTDAIGKAYSDAPDGPRVEKGGVAEILRTGNNPPGANYVLKRNVLTKSMGAFDTGSSLLGATTVKFTQGEDTEGEYNKVAASVAAPATVGVRPSVHGDVIHSRPQPINYGGTNGTVVYYGSNDGHFRAVSAATGVELWSYIAPETFGRLERLRTQSPKVLYPNGITEDGVTPNVIPRKPRDYFFDGSIGVYQNKDSSQVYIYPSMRRGGRVVYAFDVSKPKEPAFKWKVGCDDSAATPVCTDAAFANIGQTWGTPALARVEGYEEGKKPLVFVVGGHDTCEDKDSPTPDCTNAKGRAVYVLDADTGSLKHTFGPTNRSVVADIALVDMNLDGMVDHGYVADMGGSVYRLDLADPLTFKLRAPADWKMTRVAFTDGDYRKFQFAPALVQTKSTVYVALGTGDREHPLASQYPYPDGRPGVLNRFYVFADDFDASKGELDLDLDAEGAMNDVSGGGTGTGCDAEAILPGGKRRGWFFDLNENEKGEQTVTSAAVVGGLLAFSTNSPTPELVNACASNLGEARGYLVNVLNGSGAIDADGDCGGGRSSAFIGGGLPPSPVITRVNIDGVVRTVCIGCAQKEGKTISSIEAQRIRASVKAIRKPTYWFTPNASE